MAWWMLVDALMGAADLVRWARGRSLPAVSRREGTMEARLAGAAVSAVRDYFDRDRDRLEMERERLEADRERADRLLTLDRLRQAGDREIGRLRVVTAVAGASWLGSLALVGDAHAGLFSRAMSGIGWVCILGSLAASLVAQRHVARVLGRMDDRTSTGELASLSGAAALWGLVAGLASITIGRL